MIAIEDLVGTWRFVRPTDLGGYAFLHFTSTMAFDFICDGETRQPLRLCYTLEPGDMIRFRARPGDEGWTCELELDEGILLIEGEGGTVTCSRPKPDDIPPWFQEGLAAAMSRA